MKFHSDMNTAHFSLVKMTKTVPVLMTTASFCECFFLSMISIFFFPVYFPEEITHVGTASRLWPLIHKDENAHL